MARTVRESLRQRRMQRWLRREALLLAREADLFDCPEVTREAERLLDITNRFDAIVVLRSA